MIKKSQQLWLTVNFARWLLMCHNSGQQHQLLGLIDWPEAAEGHRLFICYLELTHLFNLQSTGTEQPASPLWSLGCMEHPPQRKILRRNTFHVISVVSSRMKITSWGLLWKKNGLFCMGQQVEDLCWVFSCLQIELFFLPGQPPLRQSFNKHMN